MIERKYKPLKIAFIVLITILPGSWLSAAWIDYSFPVMGTEVTMRFYLDNAEKALAAKNAVISEMHRINEAMSPYLKDSLLSKVNNEAAIKPVKITNELYNIIARSMVISELTKGAFDITFSSVGYLYDYRLGKKPTAQQLKEKVPLINYKSIQLNARKSTVFFKHKGVRIDLGGIAKGLAVDNSIDILKNFGVTDASVTAGGDTYVLGDNAGKMWNVGIKHPRAESKLISILPLANTAISTSGDYERFFIEDGKRYHHILNPKTGKSISSVQSVTILTDESTFADALSTSVFVLGVKDGLKLVEQLNNVSAIIVDSQGVMFYSSDLVEPE